ncbi:hypothetical protein TCAL_11687 [Tigriopus californicus]|uniref:Pentraxin (PTX) domain-containing protein n=1 Tax=Tigriopus californicus TaxID=6832 RepID=A0A553PLC1_TIGCA|nr:uncharacterized protein LOC131890855 [Tigriopus californicus]TRY78459.1 hypothetical protein TCAL_11687 [Tigriopus californicus]
MCLSFAGGQFLQWVAVFYAIGHALTPLTVGMEVFEFAPDNSQWNSQAKLTGTIEEATSQLTLCYRVKIYRYLPSQYYVNLMEYTIPEALACCEIRSLWTGSGPLMVLKNQFIGQSDIQVKLMRWYHHCFTFDYTDMSFEMILDGATIDQGHFNLSESTLQTQGVLMVGSAVSMDCNKPGQGSCRGLFSGQIADFNLWSRKLSQAEIQAFTNCQSEGFGDLVNWNTAQWINNNVNRFPLNLKEQLCKEKEDSFMVFPELREFIASFRFCRSLGAKMAAPFNIDQHKDMINSTRRFFADKTCDRISLGWTDEYSEGTFININDYLLEQKTTPLPKEMKEVWKFGEPNGGRLESCAELTDHDEWNDMPCSGDSKSCTSCYFKKRPLLKLRGLCRDTNFDQQYIITTNYINGKPVIKGYFRTVISWSRGIDGTHQEGRWELTSLINNASKAVLQSKSNTMYPIGRQVWTIENDVCSAGETVDKNLTLTVCEEGSYTCDSGECIDLTLRCENNQNCEDGSDEIQCTILELPDGYRTSSPPPPAILSEPVKIDLNIDIISFSEIDVNKMKISIDFYLSMTWFDPRLTFHNLREGFALNPLSLEEMKSLWFPELSFVNTAGNEISLIDDSTETYVFRNGSNYFNSLAENHETKKFYGRENPLFAYRKYTINFSCNFELQDYPFDVQNCSMDFQLRVATRQRAILMLDQVEYLGEANLLEYKVQETTVERDHPCGRQNLSSCNKIWITLKRRVGNQLLNTYLPTGSLLMTIYLSHYFKIDHYDTRIMVGLTGMLVIASLFVSTSASLPRTSYFKMIDIWMIFCFLLPFFEVILHTIVEYWTDDECYQNKRQLTDFKRKDFTFDGKVAVGASRRYRSCWQKMKNLGPQWCIDVFARVFVPLVILVFNIFYWGAALKHGGIEV